MAKLVGRLRDAAPGQGANERVEEIAADLVEHYETRTSVLEGKAMVVAMSRDMTGSAGVASDRF